MPAKTFFSLFAAVTAIAAQKCPIQFDGRVAANATLADFDTTASLFNPTFVYGQSMFSFPGSSFNVAYIERLGVVENPATSVVERLSSLRPARSPNATSLTHVV